MAGPGGQAAVHGPTARNGGGADGIAHAMEAGGAASAAGFGMLKRCQKGTAGEKGGGGCGEETACHGRPLSIALITTSISESRPPRRRFKASRKSLSH